MAETKETKSSGVLDLTTLTGSEMFCVYDTSSGKSTPLGMFTSQAEAEKNIAARRVDVVMKKKLNMSIEEVRKECEKLECVVKTMKLEAMPEDAKEEVAPLVYFIADSKTGAIIGSFDNAKEAENLAKNGKMILWLGMKGLNAVEFEKECQAVTTFQWKKRRMVEATEDEKKHIVAG